jgi:transposase
MWGLPLSVKIFLASKPVDMRKGFDGLMAIVKNHWKQDIFSGHLYVFVGHKGDRLKIIHWERGGLVLYCKRLERGRFKVQNVSIRDDSIQLDAVELSMLLDGIDFKRVYRPKLWRPSEEQYGEPNSCGVSTTGNVV